jgi:hypothetical protein
MSLDNSPFDSDVALIGTGLAPLIAARQLLAQGKTVLVLNPDFDFFLEDSELGLDPLLPFNQASLDPRRLAANLPDQVLAQLRPSFPGAVESWSGALESEGFHDERAPHVRQRSRLWITSDTGPSSDEEWSLLEDAYVGFSDADLNPKILDGIQAARRFPGCSATFGGFRGLLLPKLCEVDVSRYRNGVLEFVRERLGQDRFVLSAGQIEMMPGGLRFYARGKAVTARIHEQVLVFHTPRMTSWIVAQSKRAEVVPRLPQGIRLWEQWSILSRDDLDPEVIGTYSNLVVWAEVEGSPSSAGILNGLAVLRAGPVVSLQGKYPLDATSISNWLSHDSLTSLSSLCYDFLKWNRFSVRSMKPRSIFEWGDLDHWVFKEADSNMGPKVKIVTRCDGPVFEVVRVAQEVAREVTA